MALEKLQFKSRMPIEAYGDGGFRFGGLRVEGSVLLLSAGMEPWSVTSLAEVTPDTLSAVTNEADALDLLLLGCGADFARPPKAIAETLNDAGIALEFMATSTACRAYNVLIAEDRRVAAALIAVP